MIDPLDFEGKVVLVTGGGAGIGRATVSAFADLGASVVALESVDGDSVGERRIAAWGRTTSPVRP
ncbi:hypothetical protein A5745_07915 [Mycobacterium sp. IS-2888]|uniref:SDR family NAD(P)-dependent oxidoreductase n=1 Tax=Mycobacterium sp. IS-2888 TaxID=1834159 RepID=UPI00096D62E3|nr:SDR family NAD(P)-dependent oxidoreductase [Mycobacterium sp. IS-2888]OMC48996.1 hypothetical protein A5745_07915 [Mycobacterium sp. IS-2888]